MNTAPPLEGLVLCGGESRRMGRDKGSLLREGKTWAAVAGELLQPFVNTVYYSIRHEQRPVYEALLPGASLLTDEPDLAGRGPLGGLLSFHRYHPGDSCFLLACDLPFMEAFVLQQILAVYRESPGADAFLYRSPQSLEPMAAIYSAKWMEGLQQKIEQGKIRNYGFQAALAQAQVVTLPWNETIAASFRNANDPDALTGIQ